MSKLIEYKSKYYHYYEDDQGRFQGEYKYWWDDGQLCEHYFYKDRVNITKQVKELVEDIKNITPEEKMLIKLKLGVKCL